MLLNNGTQERLISETTVASGTTVKEGSIKSDSLLVSLWVDSVSSGTLSITVYTLTDTGKEVEVITFPTLSTNTTNLLLRKSAVSLQRFRVVATYTGVCTYEIYVRAIEGAGESSSKILGSDNWKVSQVTVGTSAVVLVAAALTDRSGILVKNWSSSQTVYIAETLVKATSAVGYPLAPRDALALDIAAGASVYAISDAANADLRLAEAGG
jgi:hypothetical protein